MTRQSLSLGNLHGLLLAALAPLGAVHDGLLLVAEDLEAVGIGVQGLHVVGQAGLGDRAVLLGGDSVLPSANEVNLEGWRLFQSISH